jgi:hypothetical protein
MTRVTVYYLLSQAKPNLAQRLLLRPRIYLPGVSPGERLMDFPAAKRNPPPLI